MVDVLKLTASAYLQNWKMVVFFSVPFLLAFLIPLLAPTPTYSTLGAAFLRTGSMYVDLTGFDVAIIVAAFLVSLFLVAFAIVGLNLLIKSQRTFTNIKTEVLEGIERYVITIFWIYLTAWVLMLLVNLVGYEFGVNQWLSPIFGLLISLPLFYAPTAIVIDEQRPFRAMESSLSMIRKRFTLFLLWIILGIAVLSFIDVAFIFLKGIIPYPRYLLLVVNALVVLPFLIMLQVQIYLTKYTILK